MDEMSKAVPRWLLDVLKVDLRAQAFAQPVLVAENTGATEDILFSLSVKDMRKKMNSIRSLDNVAED